MVGKRGKKTLPIQLKATSDNYSTVQVVGELKPIKRFLKFKVPNARFSKAYKARKWDGTINLINRNRLMVGNIEYLCEHALKAGLNVEFHLDGEIVSPLVMSDHFFGNIKYDPEVVMDILRTIPPGYDPRDYQFDSIASAMASTRAMIYLATGGGKSLILYLMGAMLHSHVNGLGLILAPRISLVEQLEQSTRFFSGNKIIPLTSIHHKDAILELKPTDNQLIISTFQSWTGWVDDGLEVPTIKYLIGDEAHTYSGKGSKSSEGKTKGGVKKYADIFKGTEIRYGLTATAPDEDLDKLQLEGLFGKSKYVKKAHELMRAGYLAKPIIHRFYIKHKLTEEDEQALALDCKDELEKMQILDGREATLEAELKDDGIMAIQIKLMQQELSSIDEERGRVRARLAQIKKDFLLGRKKRFDLITDLAKGFFDNGPMLVLGEKLEAHLKPLNQHFDEAGFQSLYLDRDSDPKTRKSVIATMGDTEGVDTTLTVTYGLFQMGIDIPTLSNVMLFSPSSSHVRVLQSIGRGLRPSSVCNVFDMIDYTDKIPENAKKRKKIYDDEYGDQYVLKEFKISL